MEPGRRDEIKQASLFGGCWRVAKSIYPLCTVVVSLSACKTRRLAMVVHVQQVNRGTDDEKNNTRGS